MKNVNSMKKKVQRLTNMFKYEIRSGKCSQADIDYILSALKHNVSPWEADAADTEEVVNK
jgi:hypothetical protein